MAARQISNADYVSIHNHSEYSNFDGLSRIGSTDIHDPKFLLSLPMYARSMGFKAIGLTDHGNIGGVFKFLQECYKEKDNKNNAIPYPTIDPILGMEAYLAKDHKVRFRTKKKGKKVIEVGQADGRKGNRHLVLLAKNFTGYQNLCRLTNASWTQGYFQDARIDLDLLAKHSEGLICSSACLSSVVNANLLHDRYDQAKKAATIFKDIFNDDFYLEVMYHGIDAEGRIIPDILKLGDELGVKVIATNDCHYTKKELSQSHEALVCMSTSKCLTDPRRLHFPFGEFYLKSAKEMAQIFGSKPELLTNTKLIAEKVNSKDIYRGMTSEMRLPRFEVPEGFAGPYEYLSHLAHEGMKKIGWDTSQRHVDRFNLELNDIKVAWDNSRLDFATYLLIVRDYINEAKKNNILVGCGRGSGYSSVLLRALGVTYGPDPLAYDLIWERFLGFDQAFFINPWDLGLDEESQLAISVAEHDERSAEEDPGGVDRY